MLTPERQRRLLLHLRAYGSGNVTDLADLLGVSTSTVRRDLREMDDRGLVNRVHGGASVVDEFEPALDFRGANRSVEKQRIGQAAAALIPDAATVLITGGTTTEAMLPFLAEHRGLTVLTNGLAIAYRLARYHQISVVVLGGVLRHDEMSLLGPLAEQALADFHVDLVCSGAFAIHPDSGLSAANVSEASTDRQLLRAARRLIVLADSAKVGRRGPVRLIGLDRISTLVTDSGAPPAELEAIRRRGVEVLTC